MILAFPACCDGFVKGGIGVGVVWWVAVLQRGDWFLWLKWVRGTPSRRGAVAAMEKQWRWMLGMLYVVAVAVIWIVASFVVQSVVGAGVSPLHIAYICNSLFVVYLPIVEGGRVFRAWLERRSVGRDQREESGSKAGADKETVHLLEDPAVGAVVAIESEELGHVNPNHVANQQEAVEAEISLEASQEVTNREWSRREIAQVSLLICPLWFLAQFTFNLSLRYTSVTVSLLSDLLVSLCLHLSLYHILVP